MSEFTPKTRLQKILCGVTTTAKTRLEKSAKYAVENAGGGGGSASNAPLEAEGTLVTDEQTGKMTITLNKTAGELYEAACAGKLVKLSMQQTITDDESGTDYVVDVTTIMTFTATRFVAESFGAVSYNFFALIGDRDDGDKPLYSGDLAETDTVVFTETTGT